MASKEKEAVRVVIRCRPFSQKEKDAGHSDIVAMDMPHASVSITDPKNPTDEPKNFTFDSVFDITARQIDVYNKIARPIVDCVLDGYNGTIFCYGQTGTGKTFSMEGIRDVPELRGIIPNSFEHIFSTIAQAGADVQFLVRVSYLEIYNEDILDLLNSDVGKLELKERPDVGVYVKDLKQVVVKSVEEMDKIMSYGNKNRTVGFTQMNATSSRSHSIFTITVERAEKAEDGSDLLRAGKLHLVDLAGSERQSKTGAAGDRLKEATKINLSLSALGNVISALVDGKSSHIPYRDSKLTRLLQDSLGGNSKTLMVATMSPASYNYDETLSTLRYASRAKQIKNKPKVNEDPKDAMLREFQEQIKILKAQLEGSTDGPGGVIIKEVEEIEEVEEVEEIEEEQEVIEEVSGSDEDEAEEDEEEGPDSESTNEIATNDPIASAQQIQAARVKKPKKEKPLSRKVIGVPPHSASLSARAPREKKKKVVIVKRVVKRLKPIDPSIEASNLAAAEEIRRLEEEKNAIMAAKDTEESEKKRLLEEAEAHHLELERIREAKEAAVQKLAALENKLLVGGVNVLEKSEQQRIELAKHAQEIEESARRERELQRELEMRDEANFNLEEHYNSLQEAAWSTGAKIKKAWNLLVKQKAEVKDLQEECQRERERLLESIRDLTRDVKFRNLIIQQYIPNNDVDLIEQFASYDESTEKWKIIHSGHAGNRQRRRSIVPTVESVQAIDRSQMTPFGKFRTSLTYDGPWDAMCAFPPVYISYTSKGKPVASGTNSAVKGMNQMTKIKDASMGAAFAKALAAADAAMIDDRKKNFIKVVDIDPELASQIYRTKQAHSASKARNYSAKSEVAPSTHSMSAIGSPRMAPSNLKSATPVLAAQALGEAFSVKPKKTGVMK